MADRNNDETALHQRIAHLTARLESEALKVNSSHQADLHTLAADCSKAMKELTAAFNQRLEEIQKKHRESLSSIEEEMDYLRELSESQHIMLQNNIEYIKDLEQRFVTKRNPPEE